MNDHRAVGTSAGLRRTLIAVITIVAVVMSTAFGLRQMPTASAAPVNVTLSDVTVTGSGEQIVDGNVVDVRMNWAANGPFNAGDTFEVAFPANFPPQPIASFDLIDEAGVAGGTCSVAQGQQTLVCTLNDAYVGKNNVKGSIGLRAQANGANKEEQYQFSVKGTQDTTVSANVPGGIKEKGVIDAYNPVDSLEKSAHVAALTDEYLIWDILIPYDTFKDAERITLKDTIEGTNHKHVAAYDPAGILREGVTQQASDNTKTSVGATFERTDSELSITIYRPQNGWLEGQDIYLTYWTQRTNEVTKEGDTYSNSIDVTANGVTTSASADMFWNTEGFGTIQGDEQKTKNPTPSSEPAKSSEPSEPAKSSESSEPAKSSEPSEPAKPSEPSEPAKSSEPSEPAKSSEPSTTVTSEPVKSSEPNRPTLPGVPTSEPSTASSSPSTPPSSPTTSPSTPAVTTTPSAPGETPEGSSDLPWWLLLIPLVPAVIWFLGKDGGSSQPLAPAPGHPAPGQPAPAPAPGQPAPATDKPADKPAPGKPAPGQPAPASTPAQAPGQPAPGKPAQQPAKPGERQEIKSVPSGATELADGVARFVA